MFFSKLEEIAKSELSGKYIVSLYAYTHIQIHSFIQMHTYIYIHVYIHIYSPVFIFMYKLITLLHICKYIKVFKSKFRLY